MRKDEMQHEKSGTEATRPGTGSTEAGGYQPPGSLRGQGHEQTGTPGSPSTLDPTAEAPPTEPADEDRDAREAPRPDLASREGQRKTRKAHSLIDKVYAWKNLYLAWRRVRANKGAHGLDRVTIRQFEANCEVHLREIQRKLVQRRFVPQPVRRVYIPKAADPKQLRPLGIPTVADRIVGQALLQVLDPIFDSSLSKRSFAFRRGRKASDAIATAVRDAAEGFCFVFDADIKSFFDRIVHSVLMSRVRARIADGRVLGLIEAFLKAGVMEDGKLRVSSEGTPQGGVVSPWLANLLLDDLDKAIEAKGWRHVRYADDFVVLCRTRQEAQDAMQYVKVVLDELQLELHDSKSRVTDFRQGFDFLGFRFSAYSIGVRSKSLERFQDKVRTLTQRQQGRNVEAVIADLNPVLRGWSGYFGIAEVAGTMGGLDRWIRMRLRAFVKQRRNRNDNIRIPKRHLEKWGLLSLLECRPVSRLAYRGAKARGGEPWFRATRSSRGVAQSQ